ncbi:hypothetical protein MUK42_35111 [Musa troglodytarum]|uniref:Uncharacterized protein n=1 Tax=Musa troglodytarum TaxID=320322 RepID=A0A9E7E9W8_9LILI|nr:hypothetical protein MUK42_35111 [Musa troglodytarum]
MHQKRQPTSKDHVIFLGTGEINFQLSQTLSCVFFISEKVYRNRVFSSKS